MNMKVLHDGDVDRLNDAIMRTVKEGFIPYGIPFAMKDKLCQIMYQDGTFITSKELALDFKYLIHPVDAEVPKNMDRGELITFNCLQYVVYVHWPTDHFQKNLRTILCLKAMFPV